MRKIQEPLSVLTVHMASSRQVPRTTLVLPLARTAPVVLYLRLALLPPRHPPVHFVLLASSSVTSKYLFARTAHLVRSRTRLARNIAIPVAKASTRAHLAPPSVSPVRQERSLARQVRPNVRTVVPATVHQVVDRTAQGVTQCRSQRLPSILLVLPAPMAKCLFTGLRSVSPALLVVRLLRGDAPKSHSTPST